MRLLPRQALEAWNTFGVPSRADWLCRATTVLEAREAVAFAADRGLPVTVLGGGSNVVLLSRVPGVVIRMEITGFEVRARQGERAMVQVGAGEDWPRLVDRCLEGGLHGLENLTDIPGTAGAAPVQNIGAYGVEVADVLEEVRCLEVPSGREVLLDRRACCLGYRDSLFKSRAPGRYLVVGVTLGLSTRPEVRVEYEGLAREIARQGLSAPSPRDVARLVRQVRRDRLPNPARLGNAGSFFVNPVVEDGVAAALLERYPDLPTFPAGPGRRKLAAGWLIERCGFKGRALGRVGVHRDHALVLVNLGGATGREVIDAAQVIRRAVRETFGVDLEMEPRVLGTDDPEDRRES
ncbi:MAG TPA: UDP-N-acetylmuramate dehydrogenase [Myxococcota bacterium]|nr:UDP-N-acetylmuramate dehydrogenase [Myxococcota bacterium]HQK52006.1 UDP-N-acetylmuramate dehydrogenase [Myxococcota bacterium]